MSIRQNPSGVSMAIKKTMFDRQNNCQPLIEKTISQAFTIKIANTLEEREEVFRLAYQVYLKKGFIRENRNEWYLQSYDASRETVILIVQDQQKNIVGSVTLVFDGETRLPAEKIYSEELKTLRKQNEKIVEISRLVIDPKFRNSKNVLVLLFNYLYVYSYFVKNFTCLAIEVNPRHTAYYQELLHFRSIGTEKPCPNVQCAPAILMYVALKHGEEEVKRIAKQTDSEKINRSLYNYFIKPQEEMLVANYLKKQAKPMTDDEKIYFSFTESGISRAVCVM